MKTVGIICEYNPFHFGHQRQFDLIRQQLGEDTRIVCVMSGNYVQRGLPAMWSKLVRAEAALRCGANLVLELPITGVLQSAEGFAHAGAEILTKLNCVDYLCFGAECGSADPLWELALQSDTPEASDELQTALGQGLPYPAARQQALRDTDHLLQSPNNILGLEYCRALIHLESPVKPMAILRSGDYHASIPHPTEPSATAVRSLYPYGNWQEYVPSETANTLKTAQWYDLRYGERAMLARLRGLSDEEWAACAHGSEGLWSKAMKASRSQPSYEAIITAIKSKRYPRTRLQRLLLCAYLGISQRALVQPIPYVRALAADENGRSILRTAKHAEQITLINSGQTPSDPDYYRMECRAADLYTLFASSDESAPCQTEQAGRIVLR